MTQQDFLMIIYESFDHLVTPQSFFESKRGNCLPDEYFDGLSMAFNQINHEVNTIDRFRGELILSDGSGGEWDIDKSDGHHGEQISELQKMGKVTYPYKNTIDVRQRSEGGLSGLLTAQHMEHLAPLLMAYLDTIKSSNDKQDNELIFDEALLNIFHGAFDNYLWKTTDINTFKNWFRMNPIGKPVFVKDMQTYFCYAVGKIQKQKKKDININKWINPIINNSNYGNLKKRATNNEKIDFINSKMALLK